MLFAADFMASMAALANTLSRTSELLKHAQVGYGKFQK